jgi:hypothetical protein
VTLIFFVALVPLASACASNAFTLDFAVHMSGSGRRAQKPSLEVRHASLLNSLSLRLSAEMGGRVECANPAVDGV